MQEETGLTTRDMVSLGAYRVQVNRGGGTLHAFYARNCEYAKGHKLTKFSNVSNANDYEHQSVRLLSRAELLDVILKKKEIGEAQWLSAIATGLLYDEYAAPNK